MLSLSRPSRLYARIFLPLKAQRGIILLRLRRLMPNLQLQKAAGNSRRKHWTKRSQTSMKGMSRSDFDSRFSSFSSLIIGPRISRHKTTFYTSTLSPSVPRLLASGKQPVRLLKHRLRKQRVLRTLMPNLLNYVLLFRGFVERRASLIFNYSSPPMKMLGLSARLSILASHCRKPRLCCLR